MSAQVDTICRYRAACLSCGWWGNEVESEETAGQDALDHDEECHR